MNRELPADLARHLAHLLKRTRRRYRKRLDQCQAHFSVTAVHELRVETRRTLALLELLTTLHFPGAGNKARRNLKRRLDVFDELRDTQVAIDLLQPWLERFPETRELVEFLRRHEKQLRLQMRRKVRRLKSRRVERMLKQFAQHVGGAGTGVQPVAAFLRAPLQRSYRRVMALRRKIQRRDTETIHRTRIAFKKLRYLCELLQPLLPGMSARRLRQMHTWQTRMGDIQDAEVLLARIERAVKRGEVSVTAVKRLHAALAKRLVLLVNAFIGAADELVKFEPRFA